MRGLPTLKNNRTLGAVTFFANLYQTYIQYLFETLKIRRSKPTVNYKSAAKKHISQSNWLKLALNELNFVLIGGAEGRV
jgi:hypothetical protein